MRLTRLTLHNFRNYQEADIRPCPGVTVFYGDNAQGKTNILEAVYLCCTGRSHRTPRDKELIFWEADFARVELQVERLGGAREIEIVIPQKERKTVKVSGNPIARSGELMGHINGVLFSPEDLRMVKDGPAERRRFVDMELSQIRPSYYYALQRYNRALVQRNRLLREIALRPALRDTLEAWDEQLCRHGAEIIEHRRRFIQRLSQSALQNHLAISGGREKLEAVYKSSIKLSETPQDTFELLRRGLCAARDQDIRRQSTSLGPHRDDLSLLLDGVDVRAFGSQGQQRTAALSLKLSELDVMHQETGEWPILMLDDVMSELDPQRRRQLLTRFESIQVLVSCTDMSDLAGASVGAAYRIQAGTSALTAAAPL